MCRGFRVVGRGLYDGRPKGASGAASHGDHGRCYTLASPPPPSLARLRRTFFRCRLHPSDTWICDRLKWQVLASTLLFGLAGYNDGLHSAAADAAPRRLSPETAREAEFSAGELSQVDQASFNEGLDRIGVEMLQQGVQVLLSPRHCLLYLLHICHCHSRRSPVTHSQPSLCVYQASPRYACGADALQPVW